MSVHDPTAGVIGPLDPASRVEQLQQRRDRDRARWLGSDMFSRPATCAETAHVDPHSTGSLVTLVDTRGGRWRRSWPQLAAAGGVDAFDNPAPPGYVYNPKTDKIRERKL